MSPQEVVHALIRYRIVSSTNLTFEGCPLGLRFCLPPPKGHPGARISSLQHRPSIQGINHRSVMMALTGIRDLTSSRYLYKAIRRTTRATPLATVSNSLPHQPRSLDMILNWIYQLFPLGAWLEVLQTRGTEALRSTRHIPH
jgi:hypothetical protein